MQMSVNGRLIKAIGIYPYSLHNGGREEYSAPSSHAGAEADRGLPFLISSFQVAVCVDIQRAGGKREGG